jgi:hypothetical protein
VVVVTAATAAAAVFRGMRSKFGWRSRENCEGCYGCGGCDFACFACEAPDLKVWLGRQWPGGLEAVEAVKAGCGDGGRAVGLASQE